MIPLGGSLLLQARPTTSSQTPSLPESCRKLACCDFMQQRSFCWLFHWNTAFPELDLTGATYTTRLCGRYRSHPAAETREDGQVGYKVVGEVALSCLVSLFLAPLPPFVPLARRAIANAKATRTSLGLRAFPTKALHPPHLALEVSTIATSPPPASLRL